LLPLLLYIVEKVYEGCYGRTTVFGMVWWVNDHLWKKQLFYGGRKMARRTDVYLFY
jgi:hypothetical protein